MADSNIIQDQLAEAQKQTTLLRDQITTDKLQAEHDLSVLHDQIVEAQAKLAALEDEFNKGYEERFQSLKAREDKVIADQETIDATNRNLAAQKISLDDLTTKTIVENQTILDQTEVLVNKNKELSRDIALANKDLNDRELALQLNLDQIAKDREDVNQKAIANTNLFNKATALNNDAIALKEDAQEVISQAQDEMKQAQDKHDEISGLIADLEAKQIAHEKALADIQTAQAILDAKTKENQVLIDQQAQNLITIQQVSETNKSTGIALKSLQISLNQQQRDLDEREKNVKALEANIQL